jgi:hypothetical protein
MHLWSGKFYDVYKFLTKAILGADQDLFGENWLGTKCNVYLISNVPLLLQCAM